MDTPNDYSSPGADPLDLLAFDSSYHFHQQQQHQQQLGFEWKNKSQHLAPTFDPLQLHHANLVAQASYGYEQADPWGVAAEQQQQEVEWAVQQADAPPPSTSTSELSSPLPYANQTQAQSTAAEVDPFGLGTDSSSFEGVAGDFGMVDFRSFDSPQPLLPPTTRCSPAFTSTVAPITPDNFPSTGSLSSSSCSSGYSPRSAFATSGQLLPLDPPSTALPPPQTQMQPQPVAKKACIACRQLKASCDNGRPCGRCVKFGRECLDRTLEEELEAKERRKRRPVVKTEDPALALSRTSHSRKKKQSSEPQLVVAASVAPHPTLPILAALPVPLPPSLPPPTLLATPPTDLATPPRIDATNPASYATSLEATREASRQLYSRSMLAILREANLRHCIFSTHVTLNSLDVPLGTMLHWHTQVSLTMLHLADMLTQEDFLLFLTGPDDFVQDPQQHPAWANSPLAPWTRLATRPLHYAFQPPALGERPLSDEDFNGPPFIPAASRESSVVSNSASSPDAPMNEMPVPWGIAAGVEMADSSHVHEAATRPLHLLPQIQIEWLPESNRAFQRWQRMLAQKLMFERSLRQRQDAPRGDSADYAPNLMRTLDAAIVSSSLRAQLKQVFSASSTGADVDRQALAADGGLDEICEHLARMDVGTSLAAHPGPDRPEDAVQNYHASFCSHGSPDHWPRHQSSSAANSSKVKRTEHMASVHTHGQGQQVLGPTSSGMEEPCMCSLSTGLPSRIRVNGAFARVFGLGLDEVRRGFAREGLAFLRHMNPPTSWPQLQRNMHANCKTMLQFAGQMALVAAARDRASSIPLSLPAPARPGFNPVTHTTIRLASGETRPAAMRKAVRVRHAAPTPPSLAECSCTSGVAARACTCGEQPQPHAAFVLTWDLDLEV